MSESKGDLGSPVGAIWIRGERLKDKVRQIFGEKEVECPNCQTTIGVTISESEVSEVWHMGHTMAVKVNSQKEKHIAIPNYKKTTKTQPDYFMHVYQENTGATPAAPWGKNTALGAKEEVQEQKLEQDGGFRRKRKS